MLDFRGGKSENGALTEKIIGCAMAVHRTLGSGFLESVYRNAVAHELVNYLTATGIGIGLVFNFGAERLEFKRKNRTYRPSRTDWPRNKSGQDDE